MATNEILQFAGTDTGTNLLTQAEYLADAQRPIGNQPGVARSKLVNKALRQASLIAAGLAEYIADNQANNITDTLTPQNIADYLQAAVGNSNAATATKLQTARTITIGDTGKSFDGSSNVSWSLAEIGLTAFGIGGSSLTSVSPNDYPLGSFSAAEPTESEAVSLGFPALGGSSGTARHWETITYGRSDRRTQIATEVFGNGTTRGRTFVRVKHDATWHPWVEIYHSGNIGDAFKGANQSLSTNGYQKLPGGLIIQWGSLNTTDTSGTITFPTAFPNAFFSVVAHDYATAYFDNSIIRFNSPTNTNVSWIAQTYTGSSVSPGGWTWIAIGH